MNEHRPAVDEHVDAFPNPKDEHMRLDDAVTVAIAALAVAALAAGMAAGALIGLVRRGRAALAQTDPAVVAAAVKAALLAELERGPVAFRPVRIEWSDAAGWPRGSSDSGAYAAAADAFRRAYAADPRPTLLGTGPAAPAPQWAERVRSSKVTDGPPAPPAAAPTSSTRSSTSTSAPTSTAGPAAPPAAAPADAAPYRTPDERRADSEARWSGAAVSPDPAPMRGRHVATQAFPRVEPVPATDAAAASSVAPVAPPAPHMRAATAAAPVEQLPAIHGYLPGATWATAAPSGAHPLAGLEHPLATHRTTAGEQ